METKSNTIIIHIPNLKEIESHEDGFHKFKIYFYVGAKKKSTKKIG